MIWAQNAPGFTKCTQRGRFAPKCTRLDPMQIESFAFTIFYCIILFFSTTTNIPFLSPHFHLYNKPVIYSCFFDSYDTYSIKLPCGR